MKSYIRLVGTIKYRVQWLFFSRSATEPIDYWLPHKPDTGALIPVHTVRLQDTNILPPNSRINLSVTLTGCAELYIVK